MERDARIVRGDKPFVFINCKSGEGIDKVVEHIVRDVLFEAQPKPISR